MAKDAEAVNVALDMNLFVADVDATEPDSTWDFTTDSMEDLGWTEFGWNTKDGVTLTFSRTSTNVEGQGSLDPLRVLVTAAPKTIAFTLEELSLTTWSFATGGATAETSGSNYLITPSDISEIDERALAMLATDGPEYFLVWYRRGVISGDTAIPFTDGGATVMPITYSVLTPSDASATMQVLTNITAFAPGS